MPYNPTYAKLYSQMKYEIRLDSNLCTKCGLANDRLPKTICSFCAKKVHHMYLERKLRQHKESREAKHGDAERRTT